MFGLMSRKKHNAEMAFVAAERDSNHAAYSAKHEALAEANRQMNDLRNNLRVAIQERDDLRAFKAKVMKGLIEANAKRKAEKEGVS